MDDSHEHYLVRELRARLGGDSSLFEVLRSTSMEGIWYWDLENPENEWLDDRCWEMLGCDPAKKKALAAEWQNLVHPDDLEEFRKSFEAHRADASHPFDQTLRFRHANGSTVWVQRRGSIIRDENDQSVRMLGSHIDVTAVKLAETGQPTTGTSLPSQSDLIHALGRVLPMAVFCKDADGRFLQVNRRFCDVVGRTEAEIIGRTDHDLFDKAAADRFRTDDLRVMDTGELFHAVEQNPDSGGGVRHIEVFKNVLLRGGQPNGVQGVFWDVTDRVAAEGELKENRQLLRTLVENTPLAVAMFDTQMRYMAWSKRWLTDYRLGDRDLSGLSHYEVFPEIGEDWKAIHQRCLRGATESREEDPFPRADGSTDYVRWVVRPWQRSDGSIGGLIMFTEVVTERVLSSAEARLSAFGLEHASVAYYLIDPEANILRVNEANCRMLGYDREELCRMTVHDVNPGFPPEAWPGHWQELREKRHMFFESSLLTKDGHEFPVEIDINFLEFDGKEYNFAFVRDISERVRNTLEREEMEHKFQEAQKLESLGVLAGGIAHDFNNLLTAMLGNVSLMKSDASANPEFLEPLTDVENAAIRASDLCKQMLAYAGKGRFVLQQINLTEVVKELVSLLQVSISKNAHLNLQLALNTPAILADAAQINQVIMNLVINASEALANKEGVITLATGTLLADDGYLASNEFAEGLTPGEYVFVEVGDNGSGMDAATRARIFDPFFTTKFTGRGLGLAAVQGIVRGHKGAMRVYSEMGSGSTFKILLPVASAAAIEIEKPPTKSADIVSDALILVIDDEESVRRTARRVLEHAGHRVLVAEDGVQGVGVFTEHRDKIRAVLLDLTMPRMDGVEAFRRLRQLRPGIPVLLMSGYNEQAAIQRFTGKGLAGFVQKPFLAKDLLSNIADVLREAKRD